MRSDSNTHQHSRSISVEFELPLMMVTESEYSQNVLKSTFAIRTVCVILSSAEKCIGEYRGTSQRSIDCIIRKENLERIPRVS